MKKPLQKRIGYRFKNSGLLEQALTHSSFTNENGLHSNDCNERLEFLGDAVLELTVSEFLYRKYPELPEGELTKRRAGLVCEPSLAYAARELSLGDFLRLGIGESQSGGRDRPSLLSDAMEAVFGAVYLDGGMEAAQDVIVNIINSIESNPLHLINDFKSALQEILQKNSLETAVYSIINETGPPHQKEFTAEVTHKGKALGTGTGRNKKEAEQAAAKEALEKY